MEINFEQLQLFIDGMKFDREAHGEEKTSYEFGLNGRLVSQNGKLSFSSIKGTVEIYNNPNIVKYLGYAAFIDELVLLVKYNSRVTSIQTNTTQIITANKVLINIPFGSTRHEFTNELFEFGEETNIVNEELIGVTENVVINQSFEEVVANETIDLNNYYELSDSNISNYEICDTTQLRSEEYNNLYDDAIIILKRDGSQAVLDRIAYQGKLNWDINRKITTVALDENIRYRRVYFTDNLNPLRVFNTKDNKLSFRTAKEFDITQNATMLQPYVTDIVDGGSIKAMSVQYAYKLITENGQTTKFSPFSKMHRIVINDSDVNFEGGAVSETTNKRVILKCPLINTKYSDIQAIAIEYEANTIPTSIRNLGIKPIAEIVEFIHNGNESEFDENITLEDITEVGNIWTYCNDITSKNNKLIAAGLRNQPSALQEKYVQDLFLLKGWDISGSTHNYLINNDPKVFRYIDPSNQQKYIYTTKTLYERFLFFGNFTLSLKNKNNPNAIETISFNNSSDLYVDYINEIWEWLSQLDLTLFLNLNITRANNAILFSTIDLLIQTDISDYFFESTINQSIIDFQNEYAFLTTNINTNNLIYGAQSVGFNNGTGVRITYKEVKDALLDKSSELYESGPLLRTKKPTLSNTFQKGEIYRTSIQFFKNNNPLFAIVLGDLYIPNGQDFIREIEEDGTIKIDTEAFYVNQSVEGNTLYGHRIEMRVEVRIPCLFKDVADTYQIQYVERTENNRTILCQGIAAPLIRFIDWRVESQSGLRYAPEVFGKWTLPFNGGPLYTVDEGFNVYDDPNRGEEYNEEPGSLIVSNLNIYDTKQTALEREITSRRMLYFDSPDLINNLISPRLIKNAQMHVIGKVKTDATGYLIREQLIGVENEPNYDAYFSALTNRVYQNLSFSRKIPYTKLKGDEKKKPYFVNVSVFSQLERRNDFIPVEEVTDLLTKGEIISGAALNTGFDISNMAMTMFAQCGVNNYLWRSGHRVKTNENERYSSENASGTNTSSGYPTIFIKGLNDVFTNNFIGPEYIESHRGQWAGERHSNSNDVVRNYVKTSDAHAIINIVLNNYNSVYGGRNRYAFSQNKFIPLGELIPIKGSASDTRSQIFTVQGDIYLSLYMRTKNDLSEALYFEEETRWLRQSPTSFKDDNSGSNSRRNNDYRRGGAWSYAVVLETEVETRFNSEYQFYRSSASIDYLIPLREIVNEAYFKRNDLRLYSPIPYNFKDNPLRISTLSASRTKLNGDFIDSWTEFLLNEFYDLELSKGIITNITNWKDSLFAVQEFETNEIFIDENSFITTDAGEQVAVKKGDGGTFTNHKKISDFGTSIRRALAEGELGWSFFDERKLAFIKFGESLSLGQELETKLQEIFEYDKIIDTEGYYDQKYKETNIRIRTESGAAYLLSYNELLKVFNGWYSYNHDIYIVWDNRVFAPCCGTTESVVICPQIFSDQLFVVQINQYFEYQIQATENPNSYEINTLPSGVKINRAAGLIYGIITVPGTYEIIINVTNTECSDSLVIEVRANIDKLAGIINGNSNTIGVLTSNIELVGLINGLAIIIGEVKQPYYFNNYVQDLALADNCDIIVYGAFSEQIGNEIVIASKLARIGASGVAQEQFQLNVGTAHNEIVYSHMGAFTDNQGFIYVTGVFTSWNGIASNRFVKLNPDGTRNNDFILGTGFNNFTTTPYVFDLDYIYVPGLFGTYQGNSTPRLAKIDKTTGDEDPAFINPGAPTTAIEVLPWTTDTILVHGYFTSWGGVTKRHLVVLNKNNGAIDNSFDSGNGPSPAGNLNPMRGVIDYANGNKLILTGLFTTYDNVARNHITRVNRNGSIDESYVIGTGFNNSYLGSPNPVGINVITDLYYDNDLGKVLACGQFDEYNGQLAPSLVRINADGSIDNSFNFSPYIAGFIVDKIIKYNDFYVATLRSLSNNFTYLLKIDINGNGRYLMDLEQDKITNCKINYYANSNSSANTTGDLYHVGVLSGNINNSANISGHLYHVGVLQGQIFGSTIHLQVPNATELETERLSWSSNNAAGAFNSVLKLPAAGFRYATFNAIDSNGTRGYYWSRTTVSTVSRRLTFTIFTNDASLGDYSRTNGFSVRLIVKGTYSQEYFNNFYANKVTKIEGLNYGFVYNSTTQKIWLDRNFGALQVATSSNDTFTYGHLFQYGRHTDNHELRTSSATNIQATSSQVEHGDFIIEHMDWWLNPEHINLWQNNYEISRLTAKSNLQGNINGITETTGVLIEQIPLPFIMTVDSVGSYSFETDSFKIQTSNLTPGYNYNIETSDGYIATGLTEDHTIIFPSGPGIHTVAITGNFPHPYFIQDFFNRDKILEINQWGTQVWVSMKDAFSGCKKLTVTAIDAPNLSQVTDMSFMFSECHLFNTNINHWNVSNVTNMQHLFAECLLYNQPLNNWNVSSVQNMSGMFRDCNVFNQPLNNWNVSNVTTMQSMFFRNYAFDQPLDNWNVSNLIYADSMFNIATIFNQDITGWDVSNLQSMNNMFSGTTLFNQPIGVWNVSNVTQMIETFSNTTVFNQPLDAWNVSNVTSMLGMFSQAIAFNQNINIWNVSSVIEIHYMFALTEAFNQPLNLWDVSNVINMQNMFAEAIAFNQNISVWNVGNVTNMYAMFGGATVFNQPLDAWNVSNVINMGSMFGNAIAFNQPLNSWNVSNVTQMNSMFSQAIAFNQSLNLWNTTSLINCAFMFYGTNLFNQPLNTFNVSNVTNMDFMFSQAIAFNQPLDLWNVSNVTRMQYMFENATIFNSNITTWNTVNVTNMGSMFSQAIAFNQPIGVWNVSSVEEMSSMFLNATAFNQDIGAWNISNVNGWAFGQFMWFKTDLDYDAVYLDSIYNNWSLLNVKPNVTIGFGTIKYTAASQAGRDILTNAPNNWSISDGGI